ncbi:hypothetical protein [Clostridium botulinum]|uniref:hypothetical protein n=1 Tax=Clostridium botulinum TaxID=1491 RepID=UPI00174E070D|nr:hypothetical protein [Clostridium botulinum]MBD5589119.1 hypothetical protein [Clostridium botulinum]MBY6842834.1 hypothetical protein [Clostridium botulinum]
MENVKIELNFKDGKYKEKNMNFIKLLHKAISTNYREYDVKYFSGDYSTMDDPWYDTIAILNKDGDFINKIPLPVFIEIIGIDITDDEWREHPTFELEKIDYLIKYCKSLCNIVDDSDNRIKEIKKYLEDNKSNLDPKVLKMLEKKDEVFSIHDRYDFDYIFYNKEIEAFVAGLTTACYEAILNLKTLKEILEDINLN